MPSIIPVPIRPAADSRAKRNPHFAYASSTAISTICETTNSTRKNVS